MSELGEILKRARMEKQLTLEELQEQTKIRKTYLQAIEEGNYKVLPGNFYVRAFIKSYAEAVGLDPAEVMNHYKNVIPHTQIETKVEPPRKRSRKLSNTDKIAKWASSFLLLSFVVLIIFVIYIFVINQDDSTNNSLMDPTRLTNEEQNLSENEQEEPVPAEKPEPEPQPEPEPEPEVQVSYVGTDSTTNIYTVNHADEFSVEFEASNGQCWIQIREVNGSGKVLKEKTYAKGEQDTLTSKEPIWIRFGNPSAVQIKVNGKLLEEEQLKESSPRNIQLNLSNGKKAELAE
ncbi:helix-turn-helix domain-containing protein [Marinicrinis sediminis]|uniref:Helix-turn-helix domain-containing protein n=1 Tax=Marinicrinis sediminis TaxID=1652465 RepID=A0ABW5R4U6_9BACL